MLAACLICINRLRRLAGAVTPRAAAFRYCDNTRLF
jgi:hypothetical protein